MPSSKKMRMPKAVLGLSGGVDSSVSALLLKNAGYEVLGVYLKSSVTKDESEAARRAASDVGILYEEIDIGNSLFEQVCRPFISGYLSGKTPNPCVFCNPLVKFKALSEAAAAFGAEKIATGHYANIVFIPTQNRYALAPGQPGHDQSYMLYRVPQEILGKLVFPLGGKTKREVRQLATENGINAAQKPDSMEICFIKDGDRVGFIEKYAGKKPLCGNFIDREGKILGRHGGIHRYTVGQRKGLEISLGSPVYVSNIDPVTGDITLSEPGGEYKREVFFSDCVWNIETPDEFEAGIRVRHSKGFTAGTVRRNRDNTALASFPGGIRAPTPGQSLVCYIEIPGIGRVVAGGGRIE
jgi:tRNA-specific 2-thiouridylase